MEKDRLWREQELRDQLEYPWDWCDHFTDDERVDEATKHRNFRNKHLMELGKELGPITVPHKTRRSLLDRA